MIPCLVFPHEVADGPSNMARDHALLDFVDADPSRAVLRTYAWTEPTLSLGYFQRVEQLRENPIWAGLARVRRPSGGGAIWHRNELTYALVVPRTHPLAGRPSDLYRAVHAAFVTLLRDQGHDAHRRGRDDLDSASPQPLPRPFLCFHDHDPEDVLVGPHKVVGSAQRRRPSAVLQHGSLLLAPAPQTPDLPGLNTEQRALTTIHDQFCNLVATRLPSALGLDPIESAPAARLLAQADTLARTLYRLDAWTARR